MCAERRVTGGDMALTKAEMAERLFEEVGLNKREAKEFVDAFFDALRESLERGAGHQAFGLRQLRPAQKNQRPAATRKPARRSRFPRAPW